MEQNDRLEKNKDFFQGKQLFNTKLLQFSIYYNLLKYSMLRVVFQGLVVRFYAQI